MSQLFRRALYMLFGVLPCAGAIAFIFYGLIHPEKQVGFFFAVFSILSLSGFVSGLVAVLFLNSLKPKSRRIIRIGVIAGLVVYFPLAVFGLLYFHSFLLLAPLIVGIALIFELGAPNKALQRAEKDEVQLEALRRAAVELRR